MIDWVLRKISNSYRKKKLEEFLEIEDAGNITCEKCGNKCGPSVGKSSSPIGDGKVRCSDCWDWL